MKCNNCGQENPRGARYCGYCQQELVKKQPAKLFERWGIIVGLFAVVVCLVIGFMIYRAGMSACVSDYVDKNHEHVWKAASCEAPKTCTICGKTEGIKSHDWEYATCLAPSTCRRCGFSLGTKGDHSWVAATEDSPETCSVCGETRGNALRRLYLGNRLTIGVYEQDGNWENDKEAIEWLVLDIQDNRALLLSRYALDSKPYDTDYEAVDWEHCSLRQWLNGRFLKFSFSEAEKKAILSTTVNNSVLQGNQEWERTGGDNTQDQVFLLSYQEVMQYFGSAEDRVCTVTPYAAEMGADTREYNGHITEAGWWWLRSPGEKEHHAAMVNFDGNCYSNAVANEYLSVRPAMWVDLDVLSTLDYEILENEDLLYGVLAEAICERLPIAAYAMTDKNEVYSYSGKTLTQKTDWYYFYSRTNEIVIKDVSSDGKALYIRYPSTITETGYRDCWFATKDILGDLNLDVWGFLANNEIKTYRIEYEDELTGYGTIPKGATGYMLGEHPLGKRLVIYTRDYEKTVLGIKTAEQMALLPD